MKFSLFILILLSLGCYKKHDEIEAIPVQEIHFKTTLKNHTPGVDYIINKNLLVKKELIIEEGVEIIVEEGCGIDVLDSGSIKINGSNQNHVIFKSKNDAGRWNGIHISSPLDNHINFTEISGAGLQGNNHAAVEITQTGQLSLYASKITDNGDASGLLMTENAICNLEACELSGNNFPVQMDLFAKLQFNECHFNGNQHDMIRVRNNNGSALLAYRPLSIIHYGLPYFFTSSLLLNTSKVSIEAGSTLLFEMGHGINTISSMVSGTLLQVNGKNGNPVKFGSFHSGEFDRWRGISLYSGMHKIQYAVFEKAYTGGKTIGTLSLYAYSNIDCKYSTFNAEPEFCNISIFGKYVVYNSDIKTRNTFKNLKLPCML
jgi:hypothetical protein